MPAKATRRLTAREAILLAAVDLYSRNARASLDEVAAAAGVSRATLFRQFADRDDLVRVAGLEALDDLEASLAAADLKRGTPEARLLRLLGVLVPAGQRLRFVFASGDMVDDPRLAAASDRLDRYIGPVVRAASKGGVIRPDVDEAWFAEVFEALLFACWTTVAKGAMAPADAPGVLARTLIDGFGQGRRSA